MLSIILVRDPQMKSTRLYDLHPASVPWFCGQFRFCGLGRNVFREYERYIETAFARFQNAYRRYRGDGALFPDRCRSQHSAPSVRFSLEHSSLCVGASAAPFSISAWITSPNSTERCLGSKCLTHTLDPWDTPIQSFLLSSIDLRSLPLLRSIPPSRKYPTV